MNTMRIGLLVGAAFLSLSLAGPMVGWAEDGAGPAAATGPAHHGVRQEGPLQNLEKLIADLDLTADQKAQIKTIVDDFKAKNEEFRDANKEELQKLMKAVREAKESGDQAKLKEAMEAMQAARANAPKLKDLLEKVAAVLTPEQKEKFQAAIEDLKEKMQEKRQDHKEDGAAPAK